MSARRTKPSPRVKQLITGDAMIEAAFRKAMAALRGLSPQERLRVMRAVSAFYQEEESGHEQH